MATFNNNNKSCPITGPFCWKNPLQVAALFAVLPFAIKGVMFVFAALSKGVDALVK
jgi:hypothetical protein